MKKKHLRWIAIAAAVMACAVFAWRIAYASVKRIDNIPSLALAAEMECTELHAKLEGYHVDQLAEIWGEPRIPEAGRYVWELDEDTSLRVTAKPNGIAVLFDKIEQGKNH